MSDHETSSRLLLSFVVCHISIYQLSRLRQGFWCRTSSLKGPDMNEYYYFGDMQFEAPFK